MRNVDEMDNVTATAAGDYPALHRMFGAYFHQDWQSEHATSTGAVQAFLRDAPYATVEAARQEIDRLLASTLDDGALGRLLREGLDCNYVPQVDELTDRAWLSRVRDLLHPVRPA